MNEKAFSVIFLLPAIVLVVGSAIRADSYSRELVPIASKFPNAATGQIIDLPPMKGVGTVYVTEAQWQSVAPYWDTALVCTCLLVTVLAGWILHQAYTGFMRGYRSG